MAQIKMTNDYFVFSFGAVALPTRLSGVQLETLHQRVVVTKRAVAMVAPILSLEDVRHCSLNTSRITAK